MTSLIDFAEILRDPHTRRQEDLERQFPFYALTSPELPAPGPNFVAAAIALGDTAPEYVGKRAGSRLLRCGTYLPYLYRRALYDELFRLNVAVRGQLTQAVFVPGHVYADPTASCNGGPAPARVMVIGKHPGQEELQQQQNFVGPTSELFLDALAELGAGPGVVAEWYVTNLVKWGQLAGQGGSLPQAWIKDCLVLLHQELRLVRPDYVLCLGSDASKALLGTQYGVTTMSGKVLGYRVPVYSEEEEPQYHCCRVMAATHPAAVSRTPELAEDFKLQLAGFLQRVNAGTGAVAVAESAGADNHHEIYTHEDLRRVVDAIRNDPDTSRRIIAIDAEWHGEQPTDDDAYLRTIQFSSAHGEAYTVVLRHQGGAPAFQPGISHALRELSRLLKRDVAENYYPRIGGWFLRADLPWLIHAGLDLREEYTPAATLEEAKQQGGWEASLMYHAVHEATSYKLEDVAAKLTTAPRWDSTLRQWRCDYCKKLGIKESELGGYGQCPDWILCPYGCWDADTTRQIAIQCMREGDGLLSHDRFGNDSWAPYWVAHAASLAFLEMEMTGILLDKARVDELTQLFMSAELQLLAAFRQDIKWPEFNPASAPQCVAFLFGEEYCAQRKAKPDATLSIVPPGAVTLRLPPVKTTGKRSRMWAELVASGEAAQHTPSTDKEVLGILGQQAPLAMRLRDLRFLGQVLASILRRPLVTKVDGVEEINTDAQGYWQYPAGLAGAVCRDGRVRTHLFQTKETGRASSARPPLQNVSKRREDDYGRILGRQGRDDKPVGDYLDIFGGPRYHWPLRSVLVASPGCVLVESDYIGAELAAIAWLSGDEVMIDHVRRNTLPSTHPDHYDIHSQTTVRVFRLGCPPTKAGLKEAGYKGMRVAAKNVNFGIPYGRSAGAIARQCREEGVAVSERDTQQIVDDYFNTYRRVDDFLRECRRRSQAERWLCNLSGRYRRFSPSRERGVIGEQERQAQNFPIQSAVADAVSRALANLWAYRVAHPEAGFKFLLQIHDAILFEVPLANVRAFVCNERDDQGAITQSGIVQRCMVDEVPIWPTRLDGTTLPVAQPYYFGLDTTLYRSWGVPLTPADIAESGLGELAL